MTPQNSQFMEKNTSVLFQNHPQRYAKSIYSDWFSLISKTYRAQPEISLRQHSKILRPHGKSSAHTYPYSWYLRHCWRVIRRTRNRTCLLCCWSKRDLQDNGVVLDFSLCSCLERLYRACQVDCLEPRMLARSVVCLLWMVRKIQFISAMKLF